jgi:hypothetical protein
MGFYFDRLFIHFNNPKYHIIDTVEDIATYTNMFNGNRYAVSNIVGVVPCGQMLIVANSIAKLIVFGMVGGHFGEAREARRDGGVCRGKRGTAGASILIAKGRKRAVPGGAFTLLEKAFSLIGARCSVLNITFHFLRKGSPKL